MTARHAAPHCFQTVTFRVVRHRLDTFPCPAVILERHSRPTGSHLLELLISAHNSPCLGVGFRTPTHAGAIYFV